MSTSNHYVESPPVRELAFHVNERRLLGEVGLLFSSATAAFAECVQNSYRAGATTLRVIADPTTRTVIFRDNGEGLVEPEKLLTVAESGWDESHVKHAAGVGGFALWAIATDVEVRSMPANGAPPWCMRFTDAALRGETPVVVEPMSLSLWAAHGDEPHGVEIRATLKETATFPSVDASGSSAWRHRFPLAITIDAPGANAQNGNASATYTVTPYAGYEIPTSVGNLYVAEHPQDTAFAGTAHGQFLAVEWEHRGAGVVSFSQEIFTPDACEGLPGDVIAELIHRLYWRGVELVWIVAPTTNVEAKLPDRETLVRDEGFRSATRVIAGALLAEFNVEEIRDTFVELAKGAAIILMADLERMAVGNQLRSRFGRLRLSDFTPTPFLALAGYHDATGGMLLTGATCSLCRNGDPDFEVDYDACSYLVKPRYRTPFAMLAAAQGLPAVNSDTKTNREGLIPLRIAAGAFLVVDELNAVFARDLRFIAPDGSTVAPIANALWEGPFEDLAGELAEVFPTATGSIHVVFPLPSDDGTDRSLPDAVMGYVQRSKVFDTYVTIMAGEHAGSDFALNLWDYVEPDGESWDATLLVTDAQRVVAEALGGPYIVAAERAAALADLINALSIPLVTDRRVERIVKRGLAAGIDEVRLNAIVSAGQTLLAVLRFLRGEHSQTVAG